MSEIHPSSKDDYQLGHYQIRIKGHLDEQWADWFGGLTITLEEDGYTLLTGPLVDQAALFGLLRTELSGPEIARQLVVSMSTMRTHTQNIYNKLGVNNRRAAIRRAEDLELL